LLVLVDIALAGFILARVDVKWVVALINVSKRRKRSKNPGNEKLVQSRICLLLPMWCLDRSI
jgi:hypothetical protein